MIALRSRAGGAWRTLARFSESLWAAPTLVLLALVVYGVYSLAWPLGPGRDLGTYLRVYIQLFDPDAIYPQAMAARTPVAPLVVGGLLDAGAVVAELAMALLYALSILAWCAVARRFGAAATVATAVGLLAFPGFVMLFHELSSDSVYAAAFAFTAPLVARAIERPGVGRAAALGGAVAALVLIRPSSQVFLLLALVPLLGRGPVRDRAARTAAFAAAAVLPLAGWAVHNGLRFDDYTVARGGGATLPFFRAFVVDRIVSPDNGPASRELARAVEQRLLTREPYRSYGITLEEFFSSGSGRMHEDFIGLSDRTWGWDDDYAHVAAAGREAIRAHPGTYARGVVRDVGILLRSPLLLGVRAGGDDGTAAAPAASETIVVDGRTLPKPTEDELIPAARQSGFVSTPDGRIREVWTSPTAHHIEYRDAADARRAATLDRRLNAAFDVFSDRRGNVGLQRWLDRASRWYPRTILLLVVGAIALAVRRPRRWTIPAVLAGSALLLGVTTMLAVYPVAEYVVPVAPAFVLLAAVGLLGRDAAVPAYSRLRTATWWPAKTRSA